MPLNIRNPETEQALKERLGREARRKSKGNALVERLNEIGKHCASLPVLDDRSPDEMLYDTRGLPR